MLEKRIKMGSVNILIIIWLSIKNLFYLLWYYQFLLMQTHKYFLVDD
jgi:hypothetical protein